jgi:Domain of unknown function (DUF4157)
MSSRTHAAAASRAPAVSTGTPARPVLSAVRAPMLQRACACGAVPGRGGKCADCEDKEKKRPMQRAADGGGAAPSAVPASVSRTVQSPGQSLDAGTRAAMEPRFGRDFSSVRVHTDTEAAESARAVNARAYTVGQDIAFASGQYQPSTAEGAGLLAHELAHTVQQSGFHRAVRDGSPIVASENDALEREAASAAATVTRGGDVGGLSTAAAPAIHRAPWGECVGSKQVLNEKFGEQLKKRAIAAAPEKKGKDALSNKKPGFFTFRVAEAAEDHIVEHFKKERGRWAHTNKGELQPDINADPEHDPVPYMVTEAFDHFRSGGSSRGKKKKGTKPPAKSKEKPVPTVYPTEKPPAVEEDDTPTGGPARTGARLKPDCVDFERSEIYDVTTIDGAKDKVNKLEGYRKLYEEIRQSAEYGPIGVPEWTVGTTLLAPAKLTYGVQNDADPIKICFGPTDFTKYPGVLAYAVIDTGAAEGAEKTDTGEGAVERVDYPIAFGGAKANLRVPVSFAKTKKEVVPIEDDLENGSVATLVKGLVLTELRHKTQTKISPDVIEARIDSTGLKLEIDKKAKPVLFNVGTDGTLTIASAKKIKGLPFDFKHLSLGQITSIEPNETGGIDWAGNINASIPLLGKLDVVYKGGELAIKKDLGPKDLKAPFPGVRVKEASLGLKLAPDFVPSGDLALVFGPADKPLAEAALKASTDGVGLVVAGQLKVFIPGVDKAEADVTYKGGGAYGAGSWTGTITIESSQIKLPYVESGSVVVQLASGKGVIVDGKLYLALPGDNKATVGIRREEKAWILHGGGRFKVPKVGPVDVAVRYNTATELLIASAKDVSFDILGLTAKLESLTAEIAPGRSPVFYGSGGIDLNKGKLKGSGRITLNRNGLFTAKGIVTYQFSPKLTATAGVELDEKQRLKFSGQLITSLHLFDKFGDDINLFSLDINIPIPGASIGGIGLEATIGGGVTVGYSIGPGDINPLIFSADFYPLEENSDLSLALSGSVNIPALAYLKANIFGGIVLDAFIAEVGGKLVLSGTVTLKGGLFAPFSATYKDGKIAAKLTPEIKAALLLALALDFTAWAKAGIGWLSVKTEKTWNLARREIDTGIGFSLKAPFEYATDTGVKLPTFNDIEMKKPEITTEKMKSILRQLVDGADTKEREV